MELLTKESSLIRRYFSAYESKDRKALDFLLSDDFSFSSPHDSHIGKSAYFQRCWPNSEKIRSLHIERLVGIGEEVFVLYEGETSMGDTFRNTEYFKIVDNKIKEVEVYYGSLLFLRLPVMVPEQLSPMIDLPPRTNSNLLFVAQKIVPSDQLKN